MKKKKEIIKTPFVHKEYSSEVIVVKDGKNHHVKGYEKIIDGNKGILDVFENGKHKKKVLILNDKNHENKQHEKELLEIKKDPLLNNLYNLFLQENEKKKIEKNKKTEKNKKSEKNKKTEKNKKSEKNKKKKKK